jgi:hypothetical protein
MGVIINLNLELGIFQCRKLHGQLMIRLADKSLGDLSRNRAQIILTR